MNKRIALLWLLLITAFCYLTIGTNAQITPPPGQQWARKVVTLTNSQVTNMFSSPVLLIPGVSGQIIDPIIFSLENLNGGTAYTGGGNIGLFYGNASPPTQATGNQIINTFLTSPTVTQFARNQGASIAAPGLTSAAVVGVGLYIANLSANFAQAGSAGTMRVEILYTVSAGW